MAWQSWDEFGQRVEIERGRFFSDGVDANLVRQMRKRPVDEVEVVEEERNAGFKQALDEVVDERRLARARGAGDEHVPVELGERNLERKQALIRLRDVTNGDAVARHICLLWRSERRGRVAEVAHGLKLEPLFDFSAAVVVFGDPSDE
ncbi:MAG: hypothetical protein M5U25_11385 [Planctomycetota bacterium]|nr:hypothetical protein [Planctomycetota bacterium]